MKVLVVASIFPNSEEPTKGVYAHQQMQELSKLCELKVVAPVPWVPRIRNISKWHTYSRVRRREIIDGIETYHPRYLVTPKLGRSLYGFFYFLGTYRTVTRILSDFHFDVIYACFAYPDGFAAALLRKAVKKPLAIKAAGSDINVFTKRWVRRWLTAYALRRSDRIVAVSADLKARIEKLGVSGAKIGVVQNGVDPLKFFPMDKHICRKMLSLPLEKSIILYVGGLRKVKGVKDLIASVAKMTSDGLSAMLLVLIGDGYLKTKIEEKIKSCKLGSQVRLEGTKPHSEILFWMNACDVLCLPSLSEGCPNVVLEALACARPVVSTRVGGIPDVITTEDYGILVAPRDSDALATALLRALTRSWNPGLLRDRIAGRTWVKNAEELFGELKKAASR